MLGEIRRQRIDKVHQLREQGIDPYPPDAVDRVSIARAREIADGEPATIAGRIMLLRPMGNLTFGQLHDETGDMQFMISRRDLPEDHVPGYKALTRLLDIGDFVAIEGYRLQTKTGELSVGARKVTILTKSLRPLPDKHSGLTNEEVLLRQRYLDILLHREIQDMIYAKARFWRSMRRFLEDRGFTEVQTPALELTTGGADARPFVAHHNYLGTDVCLRISMGELWQKRLLVGGLERTFEIGRQFRNENQSREHLNDYDQMEFYWAYANYETGMRLVEELFRHVISETFGTLSFTLHRNGREYQVDLGAEWARYDYYETISQIVGLDAGSATLEKLVSLIDELGIVVDRAGPGPGPGHGRAVEALPPQPARAGLPGQRAAGGLPAGQGTAGPARHRGAVPRHRGRERAGQRLQRAERPAGAGAAVRASSSGCAKPGTPKPRCPTPSSSRPLSTACHRRAGSG